MPLSEHHDRKQKQNNNNSLRLKFSYTASGCINWHRPLEICLHYPLELNRLYNPGVLLPGMHPRE